MNSLESLPHNFSGMNPYDAALPVIYGDAAETIAPWLVKSVWHELWFPERILAATNAEVGPPTPQFEEDITQLLQEGAHTLPNTWEAYEMAWKDVNLLSAASTESECYSQGAAVALKLCKESFPLLTDMDPRLLQLLREASGEQFSEWRIMAEEYGLATSKRLRDIMTEWIAPRLSRQTDEQLAAVRGAGLMYYLLGLRQAQLEHENGLTWFYKEAEAAVAGMTLPKDLSSDSRFRDDTDQSQA